MTRLGLLAVLASVVLACGAETLDAGSAGEALSDAGGLPLPSEDAGPPLTRDEATQLCQSYDEALMAGERSCWGDARPMSSGMIRQCAASLLEPGVTSATLEQLQRCIVQQAKQTGCITAIDCLGELRGSLSIGARCITNAQCATGVCLGSSVWEPTCGTCGEPLAPGSTCERDGVPCAPGYTCELDDGCDLEPCPNTGRCVPEPPRSEAPDSCGPEGGCAWPLRCDAGHCVLRAGEGEPCAQDGDCLDLLRCDEATQICAKRPTAGPREECNGPSFSEHTPCGGPMWACPMLDDGTQRCHAWIAEGKACDPNEKAGSLERCEIGLQCVDSRCRLEWPTCP